MRIRIVIPALVSIAAAAPVSAQPEVVIHLGHETPEWRSGPTGADFARLYGDPARAEPFAFLMKMPANWTMQPHVHDTGEYLTVLSGVLYMSFERDGEWSELSPGSVIAIPAGVPMWAKTGDTETVIEVNGVGPFRTDPVPEGIGLAPQSARAQAALFAPGVISTAEHDDLTPTFAPDGSRLVFARRAEGGTFTLFESFPEGEGWSLPRRLPFSGAHDDQAPAFAPDGSRLFFQSRRPAEPSLLPAADAPRNDDVWVVELGEDGWGEPRLVGPPISTAPPAGAEPFQGREMAPSVAADGTLWFWSHRPGDSHGASDLYVARPTEEGWAEPENGGSALNSEHYETHPSIAPDGSFLLLACDGCPDSRGASDLYVSRRVDGSWSTPVNLGPAVNSTAYDFGATLSPDGRQLLFSSNRSEGAEPGRQDIYVIDVAEVFALASYRIRTERSPRRASSRRARDRHARRLRPLAARRVTR